VVLDVSNLWLAELIETHGSWFRVWERGRNRLPKRILAAVCNRVPGGGLCTRFPGLRASAIWSTSRFIAEKVCEVCDLDPGRISVLGSGIRLGDFPFRPTWRPVRKLLCVGRLKRLKGFHSAVESMRWQIGRELSIVGVPDDPGYERELREMSREIGRVGFLPPVDRALLPELFGEYDALVFPSEGAEAFSRLVLEAMACGLPVVATRRGGTSEAIRDGETGLFFGTGDAKSLAAAVDRLDGDPELRRRIVLGAREEAEERFDIDGVVRRVEEVLTAVVDGTRPPFLVAPPAR
jgi:glycosyltransferase involved in cell wall biosynthesis